MPCITTTYDTPGPGHRWWLRCRAARRRWPRLVQLVDEAERTLEGTVRRAVVIDAEEARSTSSRPSRSSAASSSLRCAQPGRRNSRLPTRRARTSAPTATTTSCASARRAHPQGLRPRSHRGCAAGAPRAPCALTRCCSPRDCLEMEGGQLADLYFARWRGENFFKDCGAVGLDQHRGNCGRMVANVAVMTEERLEHRAKRDEQKRRALLVERERRWACASCRKARETSAR